MAVGLFISCVACESMTDPELEPCTLVLVSAHDGKTYRYEAWGGPPPENLLGVSRWWWEGDCDSEA